MVSEMIKEKKYDIVSLYTCTRLNGNRYQSRAFMLLPMTGNIGQIIGPMLGMVLSKLAEMTS
jgi:hypothetical protein